jgi:hypothetical protein
MVVFFWYLFNLEVKILPYLDIITRIASNLRVLGLCVGYGRKHSMGAEGPNAEFPATSQTSNLNPIITCQF